MCHRHKTVQESQTQNRPRVTDTKLSMSHRHKTVDESQTQNCPRITDTELYKSHRHRTAQESQTQNSPRVTNTNCPRVTDTKLSKSQTQNCTVSHFGNFGSAYPKNHERHSSLYPAVGTLQLILHIQFRRSLIYSFRHLYTKIHGCAAFILLLFFLWMKIITSLFNCVGL
jgi:hypothetical protein